MRRRARQIDETRQRITEAAVRLHTTVGPARTTISGVAEEAGVTRLTVYRHFEDQDALFEACMGHWFATNPPPDIEAWRALEPMAARAHRAFGELYTWYRDHGEELFPIYRDETAMPESARAATAAMADGFAEAIVSSGEAPPAQLAVVRHLVDFWTWRSLVADRGLDIGPATDVAVAMLLAVGPAAEAPGE